MTRTTPVSRQLVTGIVRVLDPAIASAAALGGYILAYGPVYHPSLIEFYVVAIGIGILLQVNLFHLFRLYEFERLRNFYYQVGRMSAAWAIMLFLLVTVAFLTKTSTEFSRSWFIVWFAAGWGGGLFFCEFSFLSAYGNGSVRDA